MIFDKTGRRAITGSDDTLVKIWSAETVCSSMLAAVIPVKLHILM